MAFSSSVYGVLSQAGERIYQRQTKGKEKANTFVVAIGTLISAILGAATFLLQSGAENLPDWLSPLVVILGMVGTLFGVSRTRNGVTRSTLDDMNREVADMIDEQQRDAGHPGVPEPVAPTTSTNAGSVASAPAGGSTANRGQHDIANELDNIAKRLA